MTSVNPQRRLISSLAHMLDQKTVAFIDGANLHALCRMLATDIDFGKLRTVLRAHSELIRCKYYTCLRNNGDGDDHSSIKPLVDWLDYNGFDLVTRDAKEVQDANGVRRLKGEIDVDMAVDIVLTAPKVDHIIIFSGNGSLVPAVRAAKDAGAGVSVVSSIETRPAIVADEMRRTPDHFIEIADFLDIIAR